MCARETGRQTDSWMDRPESATKITSLIKELLLLLPLVSPSIKQQTAADGQMPERPSDADAAAVAAALTGLNRSHCLLFIPVQYMNIYQFNTSIQNLCAS